MVKADFFKCAIPINGPDTNRPVGGWSFLIMTFAAARSLICSLLTIRTVHAARNLIARGATNFVPGRIPIRFWRISGLGFGWATGLGFV